MDEEEEKPASKAQRVESDAHLCPVCSDILVEPHSSVQCGHSFCIVCINGISEAAAAEQNLKPARLEASEPPWKDRPLKCPYCRTESVFTSNRSLRELVKQSYPARYEQRWAEAWKTSLWSMLMYLKQKDRNLGVWTSMYPLRQSQVLGLLCALESQTWLQGDHQLFETVLDMVDGGRLLKGAGSKLTDSDTDVLVTGGLTIFFQHAWYNWQPGTRKKIVSNQTE